MGDTDGRSACGVFIESEANKEAIYIKGKIFFTSTVYNGYWNYF